ncbi:DEAD/DEAH box helicase [Actinomarinicola tropica]|uniref:DEAD/DEAH box helicase n=1 Tax=Actinomarinicola tropica TaxID=2789776 RepID=A0A5Q2RKI4_9ACTN|nr:DEAD/DEAH box helicase [Actinomarinicola tropica]QGG94370.1 DEAD/DEAH box helicase [Actinomarinicola tropica]
MDPFAQLHPSLQHHIVNSLGWAQLRPLQSAAIEPTLAGHHSLLLAPTAGGKTEAAVFPALTRMASEGWAPLSVLYLCPLRALVNNLEPRLRAYASYTGHRVGAWHGDVGPTARARLVQEPPDLLLTTPESLEAILISRRVDERWLLGNVRAVVVDEVHAFAEADRGWHLLSVLERITHLAGREVQRIGLSATVGNPSELLSWLTSTCTAPAEVVAPAAEAIAEPEVTVDYVGGLPNAATVISRLHSGEKRLVFVDSRVRAEKLTHELRARSVETYVSHGSLGRDERRRAEQAFAEGDDCVIVATSALELGIDVGDLDQVLQIDAPSSVASFLQRIGRSGRRTGTSRNMTFLTTTPEAMWQAAGVLHLWSTGHVEPVQPPAFPVHILSQQLLALVLQEGGIGQETWIEWLGAPFVLGPDVDAVSGSVIEHLLSTGYLHADQGLLGLGPRAESDYGYRNFLDLTSVFTSPPVFRVVAGRTEVGQVHDLGLWAALTARGGRRVLLLAGRSWKILDVDWRRHVVHVQATEAMGVVSYRGASAPFSYELAQAIGSVLAGIDPPGVVSRRARDQLRDGREGFVTLDPSSSTLLRRTSSGNEWWTFAGSRANVELAARIQTLRGDKRPFGELSIAVDDEVDVADLTRSVDRRTDATNLLELSDELVDGLKFADSLPRWLADTIVLDRLADPRAVEATLEKPVSGLTV